MRKHSIYGRTHLTQLRRTEQTHLFFGGGYSEKWVPRWALDPPTRLLYGYACRGAPRCVGVVFVRENGFLVKSVWGVDTLARIRVTATREKRKETVPDQGWT